MNGRRALELANMERKKARAGYAVWGEFVRQCEVELGQPWAEIRERFDDLHRRGLTNIGEKP